MAAKENLWILTEERPKPEVIGEILGRFAKDRKFACFIKKITILPVLQDNRFTFLYEVRGFECNKVNKIFIKSVSGSSSFVDFLIFYQEAQPNHKDTPIYAIEETKTDDKESRNTGVYQRSSKFVFLEQYYPDMKKIMLYNLKIDQKLKATSTYVFGTRLLMTLGVEIMGKKLDDAIFRPFGTVEEIINFKTKMRKAHIGNAPISVAHVNNEIHVSGRLFKSGSLSHDPNIGALSVICAAIRKLGWNEPIVITNHELEQKHLGRGNKFIKIANKLNLKLEGLVLPPSSVKATYWDYEKEGEKLGTIFIHIVIESFTEGYSIFENHAGCEKGYFITKDGEHIPLEKYSDRNAYKMGDKSKIIKIPDLIIIDFGRSEIINVEGKRYEFRGQAIEDLKAYGDIENRYIKKYYPKFTITRTVVLYGSKEDKIIEVEIGFLLNENGDLVLGIRAPEIFREAIKRLIDFWS